MSIAAIGNRPFCQVEQFKPRGSFNKPLKVTSRAMDARIGYALPTTGIPIEVGAVAPAILFGPFCLLPARRLLLEDGEPVKIGSRALELLVALAEHPGKLLSKNSLIERVWPNTTVVEANLSVHVAALRKALRDGSGENRYLVNMPGRGYRFVAPITYVDDYEPAVPTTMRPSHNLPELLTPLIGRDDCIEELAEQISRLRLLTITGPGGIGKSATALALAERQTNVYEHGVWQVDLAQLTEPSQVPSAVATVFDPDTRSARPLYDLLIAIKQKRMLLVLDNCTHVIAAAATLVTEVLRAAPGVHVLATSREPLRAEAEHVHRLSPLAFPVASATLTAAQALRFPAVRLFVERLAASVGEYNLDDTHAQILAKVCEALDGLPLAIELAAARAGVLGIKGVADCMDRPFELLVQGHRTAPLRQQTMYAALEWSYRLLNDFEQSILRRLSDFEGSFSPHAAATVAAHSGRSDSEVLGNVLSLVAKSLVMADIHGTEPRLWLLRTTRAYLRKKRAENREHTAPNFADIEHDAGAHQSSVGTQK